MSTADERRPSTESGLGAGPPPLLGRDDEVSELRTAVAAACRGSAQLIVVEGEAGIGKSRVLAEAVADAPGTVLAATGHPLEQDRPFGLLCDVLGPGWSLPSGAAEHRHGAADAVLDEIERRAAQAPLVLALDDLHWADASTVLSIDQVLRRIGDRPVAVIASARPAPRSEHLLRLLDAGPPGQVRRTTLGALDDDDVARLVEEILGAEPAEALLDQVAGAAGNPFFVTELLAALLDDGAITVDGGRAELRSPRSAPSLRLAILRRAGMLPADSLEVLRVATVLGARFDLDDLSLVLDRPASDLLGAVAEPLAAGVLVEHGGRLAFRHDLVREAVYHDLPTSARRALHLQAGRMLAAAGRPATAVARHFAAGATPGDAEAIAWLRRAASEAMTHAPDVAVQVLAVAVDLAVDSARSTRDELIVELATARLWAGQIAVSRMTLEELVGRPHDPSVDGLARLGLIQTLIVEGRPQDALPHCDAVEHANDIDPVQRARARNDAAMARLMGGDLAGAERDADRALEDGERLGDDAAVCGALAALSWVANLRGSADESVALGRRAIAVAEASDGPEARRRYPQSYLGLVLMAEEDLEEGRRLFEAGRRVAEELGDVWPLPIHHFGSVLATFHAGQVEDAAAELAAAAAVAEETGTRMFVVWSRAVAALLALHRDDLVDAEAHLCAGDAEVESAGPGMGYDWLLWARACWLDASGDVGGATAQLSLAWDVGETLGIIGPRRLFAPDLVRCALAADARGTAEQVTSALEAAPTTSRSTTARAAALRCAGLLRSDPGPAVAAVELLRSGPRRLELASACEDAAGLLARGGRGPDACELLGEARHIYESGGALRGRRRTEAALRSLGVSIGARGRRQRPSIGWEALTPTEVEVTRLAAEGLTNPQIGERLFISRRTVETHLSHVFTKLGVTSRVALATEVAKRATTPDPDPAGAPQPERA